MNAPSCLSTVMELSHLIAQKETTCRALLNILHEERRAIRSLAIERVHSLNGERLALLESLRQLVQKTDELTHDLVRQRGIPAPASLPTLLEQLTPEEAGELRSRYRSLARISELIREELRQNASLIETIRSLIDRTLSTGNAAAWEQGGYGSDGRRTAAPTTVLLSHQG
ncbi:MAG: flagellar protein FlgN [Nitrospira sp.]|nr:flagellar protein FlgN [Nitrospira sp.]